MKTRICMVAAVFAAVFAAALSGCGEVTQELPVTGENTGVQESVTADHPQVSISDEAAPEITGYEYGGHRYEIYASGGASWEEIREMCEAQGGYLAAITSEEENAFLYDLARDKGFEAVLFGLYLDEDSGEWKWLSGEPAEYFSWQEGEPNNSTGVEFYGMFYPDFEEGRWNDGDRNDIEAYICEWD